MPFSPLTIHTKPHLLIFKSTTNNTAAMITAKNGGVLKLGAADMYSDVVSLTPESSLPAAAATPKGAPGMKGKEAVEPDPGELEPDEPDEPEEPDEPGEPDEPEDEPEEPEDPEDPGDPETPDEPDEPDDPDIPEEIDEPDEPTDPPPDDDDEDPPPGIAICSNDVLVSLSIPFLFVPSRQLPPAR